MRAGVEAESKQVEGRQHYFDYNFSVPLLLDAVTKKVKF